MARLLVALLFLIISQVSFAQIEKQANAVLLTRDFNEFKRFAEIYTMEKDSIRIKSGINRELASGFNESVFYIVKHYPFNRAVSITCELRVNILTQGNLIIYFYLESKDMKNFPKSFETTSDTSYCFSDSKRLDMLNVAFEENFLTPINNTELFVDTIYYGVDCGFKRSLTFEQQQIDTWVRNTDTASLYEWLTSTNTEKQIYAVQGFYSLYQKGLKITGNIKKISKNIVRKKGLINTCAPCDARQTEISSIIRLFKFG